MNISYGDTSLTIRYLEAFLQNEYNSTLRVSGIYDTYTHNNLVDYASLPEVLNANAMYEKLNLYYVGVWNYFIVSRSTTSIIYQAKVSSENPELDQIMDDLRDGTDSTLSIFEFVKKYGWSVTTFISSGKSKELYKIVITKDERKNLIPTEAISLINLSTEQYIFDAITEDTQIKNDTSANSNCCMVIPCEPGTEYVICHRFDNPNSGDPTIQDPVEIMVSTSEEIYPDTHEGCGIDNLVTYNLVQGVMSTPYKVPDDSIIKTLVISYPYDKHTYNKSILVIKKPSNYDECVIPDPDDPDKTINIFVDSKDFISNYWLVNSKYLDYMMGSVITEYSDEEDILYAQELLSKVLTSYNILRPGAYTDDFKAAIRRYQMLDLGDDTHTPMHYSLGYIDVETEARLVRDVDRGFII